MSLKSETCANYGNHYGTSDYHMCERCEAGLENGCADYKPKAKPANKGRLIKDYK